MSLSVTQEYASFEDFDLCTRDRHVRVDQATGQVTLQRRLLLTDETGCCNSRDRENICGNIWARKDFWIEETGIFGATLCPFLQCNRPDGTLIIEVNGHPLTTSWAEGFPYWENNWRAIEIPIEYLQSGLNRFAFHSEDGSQWSLFVEPSLWPNRSAKSVDDGKTWDYDHLGFNDAYDGEYMVRLHLDRYAPQGVLTSPFLDMAALAGRHGIAPRARLYGVHIAYEGSESEGTSITLEARIGSTPSYSPESWCTWTDPSTLPLPATSTDQPWYVQWRAILRTSKAQGTPILDKVTVRAELSMDKGADKIKMVEAHNPPIVRSSYPFAHLRYDEDRLRIFRERWKLDDVIRGAESEFEQFTRLRHWTRHQWEDGWNRGVIDYCPPWDSLVILELASRQLCLGMCTHYATVFTHACACLGLTARTQIMQSHCTVEVWSNEYQKWVFMDPGGDTNDATKATYHFERSGVPMSALECHRAWVNQDFDGIQIVPESAAAIFKVQDRLRLFDRIFITQRNDELTSLHPGEPEHGAMTYHYDRYVWWEDEHTPGLPHFSLHSSRQGDFHWSVNHTRIYLRQGPQDNALEVQLDTVTPNFGGFQVRIDQNPWEARAAYFVWMLHPGRNTLQARSINLFGKEGIISRVEVQAPGR